MMDPSSQAFQTKLLYETMGSALVEKTLNVTRQHIGEWKAKGRPHRDTEGNWVHIFYNEGIPVTFEFQEDADGVLLKTRERPTFVWESTFKDKGWFNDPEIGPNWMDGMMFPASRPMDFVFGVVAEWQTPQVKTANRGRDRQKPLVRFTDIYTLVHFQPVAHFGKDAYEKDLEVETAISNVGELIPMTHVAGASINYINVHECTALTIERLTKIGFVHNPFWTCPTNHTIIGPRVNVSGY